MNENATRDCCAYADFAKLLTRKTRDLCASEPLGTRVDDAIHVCALTLAGLCLSPFPWAPLRSIKATVKRRRVNVFDQIIPEAGDFHVLDCGYLDFEDLMIFDQEDTFVVIRATRGRRFK